MNHGRESSVAGPVWRELEHTADVGLRVEATCLEDLFHGAACGTMGLVLGPRARCAQVDGPQARATRQLEFSSAAGSGDSTPAESEHSGPLSGVDVLLARWLGEVLYLLEVEGFEYALTDAMEVGPTGLTARIRGWEDTEAVERDIKGVTYHRLRLAEADERLIAEVYFDL